MSRYASEYCGRARDWALASIRQVGLVTLESTGLDLILSGDATLSQMVHGN